VGDFHSTSDPMREYKRGAVSEQGGIRRFELTPIFSQITFTGRSSLNLRSPQQSRPVYHGGVASFSGKDKDIILAAVYRCQGGEDHLILTTGKDSYLLLNRCYTTLQTNATG